MAVPGMVIRVLGKSKDTVEVQFSDGVVTAKNMIPEIQVGEYVILSNNLVIQRITEIEARRFQL
jgi:hydrogenase maturation factor